MSIFSAIIKTAVNIATLPVAMVKDVITMGGTTMGEEKTYTEQKIEQIKKESED